MIIIPPATKLRGVGILDSPCSSVRPSVRRRCPDDNFNFFIGFQFFWYMYHSGEDLGWDWIWASHLIKYAHNGWSCDLSIFGIPEVNFSARAFKRDIQRDLMGTHNISPGFCWILIFVFSQNFYAFLNEPGCSVMGAWCPDELFSLDFNLVLIYVSLWSRSWMGLKMGIIPH